MDQFKSGFTIIPHSHKQANISYVTILIDEILLRLGVMPLKVKVLLLFLSRDSMQAPSLIVP